MKKVALFTLIVFAGIFFSRAYISVPLFEMILKQRLGQSLSLNLPDGLHVGLCGAGSPLPDPERSPPCTLVVAGEKIFLFDVGSSGNIGAMGFNLGALDGVFLTHFHSDHIGNLGEVMMQRWVAGNHNAPLAVYGPKGVEKVVAGFNMAYALDSGYRTAHHTEAIAPSSGKGGVATEFNMQDEQVVTLINEGELKISAFLVGHAPIEPAVGYKITYKDRSVVISGDTVASNNLVKQAAGVDLLLHEGLSKKLVKRAQNAALSVGQKTMAKIFSDILDYHTEPEDVARLASKAEVDYLVFTHIVPMLPVPGLKQVFLGDAKKYFDKPIVVGKDGDFFSLPTGSDAIEHENRL